ncbi:CDP-alcohol phosphatidyltransferase family protein [Hydrogenophaga sp.]|uniref:CDP-alcohol phosphatidyltransferase family protein n=1 Tax=Hydrogenophaga sp. TaxID=1904254 RepID=UPI0027230E2A|nr:CDP-alcohol phosphatidyltransferase family protein [Hydrogenophaga sp.]MDO9438896.1 CDP-alcohol phosphatidyltransferase family protein [Hydrogenophaga sp.]
MHERDSDATARPLILPAMNNAKLSTAQAAADPLASATATVVALRRDTARELAAMAAVVAAIAWMLIAVAGLGIDYGVKALLCFALGAWLVWRGLPFHPHARFGPANRVTLARLALMALIAALVGEALPRPPLSAESPALWWLIVVATVTALLDAVDGALARRSGLASAFGARFDMETDAAFTIVLCALVLQTGQAGPWVLACGLMRYAFVAAARAWPWLNAPLAPSKRRQSVCVIQITTLIVCLGPIVAPWLANALAALSLALLTTSFAVDVRTLAQQRLPLQET